MTTVVRAGLLAAAFLLELAVLVGAALGAFAVDAASPLPLLLALALVTALAAAWGALASPKARWPLRGATRILFVTCWVLVGALGLAYAVAPVFGVALVVLWAVVNGVLRIVGRDL